MVNGKKLKDVNDFNKYQELIQRKIDILSKANHLQGELINNIDQRFQLLDSVASVQKDYEKICDELAAFENRINSLPEEEVSDEG